MDLANLILERANELHYEERSRDYIVFRLIHHNYICVKEGEEEQLPKFKKRNVHYDLEVHPFTCDHVMIQFKTLKWKIDKMDLKKCEKIFDVFLGQSFRDFIAFMDVDELMDHESSIEVYHGSPLEVKTPVFKDSMTFFDPVNKYSVSEYQSELNDSSTSLCEFKEWSWNFFQLCVSNEFCTWDDI
jgi:hypothetical protein